MKANTLSPASSDLTQKCQKYHFYVIVFNLCPPKWKVKGSNSSTERKVQNGILYFLTNVRFRVTKYRQLDTRTHAHTHKSTHAHAHAFSLPSFFFSPHIHTLTHSLSLSFPPFFLSPHAQADAHPHTLSLSFLQNFWRVILCQESIWQLTWWRRNSPKKRVRIQCPWTLICWCPCTSPNDILIKVG